MTRRQFMRAASGVFVPAMFGIYVPSVEAQMRKKKIAISGAFAPTSLPNLVLWLDGADATKLYKDTGLATPVAVDGDAVNGWKDKSGNGNNFIATTSVTTQALYKTGANGRNSKSVVLFNGTASQFSKTLPTLTTQTIFVVFNDTKSRTSSGYGTLLLNNAGLHGLQTVGAPGPTYKFDIYQGSENTPGSGATVAAWSLGHVDFSGAGTFNAWLNSVQFKTAAAGDSSATYDRIGGHGSEWLQGNIAEMIVYSDVKNSTDYGSVETYLIAKWGAFP